MISSNIVNDPRLEPHAINWDYFTNYPWNCDNFALHGGVYAFVFNPTKPEPWQRPHEFESCVYIGKATGYYVDCQRRGVREKLRGNMHKRMTTHHKPLMTGKCDNSSHQSIVDKYGFGVDVLNGTETGIPMWLCIMKPGPDIPEDFICRWALFLEQFELTHYHLKFKHGTIGNKDDKRERVEGSYSSDRLKSIKETNLYSFMEEDNTLEEFFG